MGITPEQLKRVTLAKQIAVELMTMDYGTENAVTVERIAMMKNGPVHEQNIGGLCAKSVEWIIEKHLKAAGF